MKSNLFIFSICLVFVVLSASAQKTKFLNKSEAQYLEGNYPKALKYLKKYHASLQKLSDQNPFLSEYYFSLSKINYGLGLLKDFEENLQASLTASAEAHGKNSKPYGLTLLRTAEAYLLYGNFKLSRKHIEEAIEILMKQASESNMELLAQLFLVKADALIGQGFYKDALNILDEYEPILVKRAVEKESFVENGSIKSKRVPAEEIPIRFSQYARLLTLKMWANGKMGRITVTDGGMNADKAFQALENWFKGKEKFLADGDLSEINYRYLYFVINRENNAASKIKDVQIEKIINDIKKTISLTHPMAQEAYLAYLEDLLRDKDRLHYPKIKNEYKDIVEKSYPKNSVHRLDLKAVEFNTKLSKDKIKDLEKEAIVLLQNEALPASHRTTERILKFLYDIAIIEKKYAHADEYLNKLVAIKKELCGDTSTIYHLTKLKLAHFYLDYTNRIEEAGKIYQESYYNLVKQQISIEHKDLITILDHLAAWLELTDRYTDAVKTVEYAKDAVKTKFDNKDILYGIELTHIANLEIGLGKYDEAEKDIQEAIGVIDTKENKQYTEHIIAYASALDTHAKLLGIKGLFDEAEETLNKSTELLEKSPHSSTTLESSKQLTGLFIQLGKYTKSQELLVGIFSEYEKLYGVNSIRLIEPLTNRGRIFLALAEYTQAEKDALRAYDIAKNTLGEKATKAAPIQRLLSDIYYTFGDYEKAEQYIRLALDSQEKQFGRNHIDVAKSLSQWALIKFQQSDAPQEIESLMLEARDIMVKKLGNKNPQYAEILKNLALIKIASGHYPEAYEALDQAEAIWQEIAGRRNINAAGIYTLRGDISYNQKNYDEAESYYNKARHLISKHFSSQHPEYVKVLSKEARVNYMQKEYKACKKEIEEALGNYKNYIKQFFPALSEGQKAKYWLTIKDDFEFYNNLAFSKLDDFKDLTGQVYDYQLLTKALLLNSSIKIRERIMNSSDGESKALLRDWIAKKELLNHALSMTNEQLEENELNPTTLQQEVERLEKSLSEKSESFGQQVENQRITYEEVRKTLAPGEVALEMIRYRYFNHVFTDSIIYAALYLDENHKRPQAIIMGDGKRMETRFFKYYRNAITGRIHDEISYGIFWEAIAQKLGLTSTIYFSADGVYNQLNLETLPTPDGKYIIDNTNIILVSSTKDLYLNKLKSKSKSKTTKHTASLFGDPKFYIASTEGNISRLNGTKHEISLLSVLLNQNQWNSMEKMGAEATEKEIKQVHDAKIVHIATHGFYKPALTTQNPSAIQAQFLQNPLLKNGLLLTGAGDLLLKTDYNFNMDDGILTAAEAMNLELDKTDLVVLSACETGLGDVSQGEGVQGLQRAFLVAGAKILVMSMFRVDDEVTQQLMVKFYEKYINTGHLRESFIAAKKEIRTAHPDPIYWGAFMMIGLE